MAQEIVNRHFASVRAAGDGAIVSRSGEVLSVTRNAAGHYSALLTEGIGRAEAVAGAAIDGATVGQISVLRVSATQWDVRTWTAAGVAADRPWSLVLHRVSSSNGV